VAAARDGSADEIVVVGHSTGGVFAPAVIARALELDPDVGRRGPRLLLLTLGSLLPAAALHPGAHRMRDLIARLATEPSLVWIDCVSRKDVLNFWDFDPVSCIGRDLGARRCNPLAWTVRFKDLVSPEYYRRVRWRFLRMHFQFIISGDRRAAYDYVMLVVGPATIPERAAHPEAVAAAFAGDGAFLPASLIGSSASAGAVLGGASLEATRI
jgi:hypothetical protein